MDTAALIAGIALMLLGVGLVFVAVFRALASLWSLGWYELVLPVVGFVLMLLGRWLIP